MRRRGRDGRTERTRRRGLVALATLIVSLIAAAPAVAQGPAQRQPIGPRVDSGYHDHAEVGAELAALERSFPTLVSRFSLGSSVEGRDLWAVKVSANVVLDENEPEVLFVAGQHAREPLSVEMALYAARELATGYGREPRISRLLDTREVWIVANLNPDGSAYDTATGRHRSWRKNRQRDDGDGAVGVDLNRNWGFRWGCCRGSSRRPSSDAYRGTAAFSAPETRHLRDFVASRVVGGVQQIRAAVDFHSFSELVMWPFGYTRADLAPGLAEPDRAALAALGRQMAAASGYRALQQSDLYLTDGTLNDWLWGSQRIHSWTVELYPRRGGRYGFYPPASLIARETARNREAILLLLDTADCVPRAAGRQAAACGVAATTVFADDFERARGWRTDPVRSRLARAGGWRRGRPGSAAPTGAAQRPIRGRRALVTGTGRQDVDGGTVAVVSPPVTLQPGGRHWIRFTSLLAHDGRASGRDSLRVSAITAGGEPVLLHHRRAGRGSAAAAWVPVIVSLDDLSGETVRILVEATDAGSDDLLEAAIDDLRVSREPRTHFP
jgi:hypothetical protein